jgi:hypothetical protein
MPLSAATVDSTGESVGRGHGHMEVFGAVGGLGGTDLSTSRMQTATGSGALVVSDISLSHAQVTIDLSACTYTLEGVPYVDIDDAARYGHALAIARDALRGMAGLLLQYRG